MSTIAREVRAAGGRALLVGGCVRDAAQERASDDIDIEVFGMRADQLEALLSERFRLDRVGESFGVLVDRIADVVAVSEQEIESLADTEELEYASAA